MFKHFQYQNAPLHMLASYYLQIRLLWRCGGYVCTEDDSIQEVIIKTSSMDVCGSKEKPLETRIGFLNLWVTRGERGSE